MMAEQKAQNVLKIVAHPDDEVLGCGGSLLRHVTKGDKVHVGVSQTELALEDQMMVQIAKLSV